MNQTTKLRFGHNSSVEDKYAGSSYNSNSQTPTAAIHLDHRHQTSS